MTCFVVLAAGRGSRLGRVGDELNKCLVPLDGRALLSRQFDLAPPGARLVVVGGYRVDQIREYVRLAHPRRHVEVVFDERWGAGPGASLLAARDVVGDDDLVFTACDTLWDRDDTLWDGDESWLAVAPLPTGVPAARWCRVETTVDHTYVTEIYDKTPDVISHSLASTALGRIVRDDLPAFWSGLEYAEAQVGEIQLSSGLYELLRTGTPLGARSIRWTDVGDETAYRRALRDLGAYDDVKPGQATYVLPEEDRVVKFHADPVRVTRRAERGKQLGDVTPRVIEPVGQYFYAYEYVPGVSVYADFNGNSEQYGITWTRRLLDWWRVNLWSTRLPHPSGWYDATVRFYHDKTFERVERLDEPLRDQALDAVTRVDFDELADGCVPGVFHGDLTYANVLAAADGGFIAIDWREDFADETTWGDLRYDLGKLLGATAFHWEAARRGDFRRWDDGPTHANEIYRYAREELDLPLEDLARIAALCLINSAPLHAAPMDEILVARGCRWLERLT